MTTMIKYPKIKTLGSDDNKNIFDIVGDEIIVEEKLDGANTRFMALNGKIIFGSHNCQLTSDEGEDTNVPKNFRKSINFIRQKFTPALISKYNKMIFFGETMVSHTLQYDWNNIPPFVGFDIWDISKQRFYGYDEMVAAYSELDIPTVPLIGKYTVPVTQSWNEFIPISKYAPPSNPKQLAEGIVIKNYKQGIFAKLVRDEFKEDSRKTFGGSPKYADDGSERIVLAFATNARIEKNIFKLVDEGNSLDMKLMTMLPKLVWADIMDEEYKYILMGNESFNPKDVRKMIAARCQKVLKQIIINNIITNDVGAE